MLDVEVREKFKIFQKSEDGRKYRDLEIDDVRFERKLLKELHLKDKVQIKNNTIASKFIEIGDIDKVTKKYDISKKIKYNLPEKGKYAPKGSILISRVRPLLGGYTIIDGDDYTFTSGDLNPIVMPDNILVDYVFKIICSPKFKTFLKYNQSTAGQKPTITEKLYNFDIPIPKDLDKTYTSFEIQEAIVAFLEFWKDGYTDIIRERILKKKPIYEAIKSIVVKNTFKHDQFIVEKFNIFVKDKNIDINFGDIIFEDKNLTEFVDIIRGKVISKKDLTVNGTYPVYSSQTKDNGLFGFINEYMHDGDAITWTTDGKHAGTTFLRSGKFNFTNVCGLITVKESDKIDIRYLSYLTKLIFPNHVDRTSQNSKLMTHHLENIKISIPHNNNLKSIDLQKIFLEFWKTIIEQIDNQLKTYQRMLELTDIIDKAFLYRTFTKIDWGKE